MSRTDDLHTALRVCTADGIVSSGHRCMEPEKASGHFDHRSLCFGNSMMTGRLGTADLIEPPAVYIFTTVTFSSGSRVHTDGHRGRIDEVRLYAGLLKSLMILRLVMR